MLTTFALTKQNDAAMCDWAWKIPREADGVLRQVLLSQAKKLSGPRV
jgi:hypothetical protein